ncbi:hypothetical protein CDAR_114921, partial [Caerostris darwini]
MRMAVSVRGLSLRRTEDRKERACLHFDLVLRFVDDYVGEATVSCVSASWILLSSGICIIA